jgi:predicted nucleic acid-binding protein
VTNGTTGRVLVDSSGWIQLLRRKGDSSVREEVRQLVLSDRAVWCDVVQVELWRGASTESDRKMLHELQAEIRSLETSTAVWKHCVDVAAKCRPRGIVVPTTDLIIYSCAAVHGVGLYHRDKHFDLLEAEGI